MDLAKTFVRNWRTTVIYSSAKLNASEKNASQVRKKLLTALPVLENFKTFNDSFYSRSIKNASKARLASNHLNTLEKLGIIKSKKTGSTKQYKINLNSRIARQSLLTYEQIKTLEYSTQLIHQKILQHISNVTQKPVLLFGSRAKGTSKKDSDYDILVFDKASVSKIKTIQKTLPVKLHIISMTLSQFKKAIEKKDNFAIEVEHNHIILQGHEAIIRILWSHHVAKN